MSTENHDALVAELSARPPVIQRVRDLGDIAKLDFSNDVAAVMVPSELLPRIQFKNHLRERSPRLDALRASIRSKGFQPTQPIIARMGQKGRWVIVDGGHRITALMTTLNRPWRRSKWLRPLFRQDFGDVYFLLYKTPRSFTKLKNAPPPSKK